MSFNTKLISTLIGVCVLAGQSEAIAGTKEVKGLVAKKAAIVGNLHKKASKALVNSAQDKVFEAYFSGDTSTKPAIDNLALSVQSKFNVAEMCLINSEGQEIARITGNEIAPSDDLSSEEASAAFFKPSFEMDVKQAYISPAYVSPDANKWVIAYVTPIEKDGKKVAILHYEHGLDVFQQALNKDVGAGSYVIAVSSDGFIVSDSRNDIPIAKNGEKEELAAYFKKIDGPLAATVKLGGDGEGSFSDGGANYLSAFKTVENWTVVAVEKQ